MTMPMLVATLAPSIVEAAPPAKDPLADAYGGQIFFLDSAPPASVSGPGWFSAHKITKKDENSDKRWPLHLMVFLKKPLDVAKLDLMVYKTDKKGNTEFIQKLEQFPQGDGRSFYFLITLRKEGVYEPNLSYTMKAIASTGAVAEGKIELDGKEEKIGGDSLDFSAGHKDIGASDKVEKPTGPFEADAAKTALKAIIYEDCKTAASKGGSAKIQIKFAAKDGKVLSADFPEDPPPPFSDATQKCIHQRFMRAKMTKGFTGADHAVAWTVTLD
jgi:hypothetical protein